MLGRARRTPATVMPRPPARPTRELRGDDVCRLAGRSDHVHWDSGLCHAEPLTDCCHHQLETLPSQVTCVVTCQLVLHRRRSNRTERESVSCRARVVVMRRHAVKEGVAGAAPDGWWWNCDHEVSILLAGQAGCVTQPVGFYLLTVRHHCCCVSSSLGCEQLILLSATRLVGVCGWVAVVVIYLAIVCRAWRKDE